MDDEHRFPGYDVLRKRDGVSWNEATRRTLDARLSLPREPRFFTPLEWLTLCALCDRIIPQPRNREPVPLAAMLDERLLSGRADGFRRARLPEQDEAWRHGLAALTADARTRCGAAFHHIDIEEQNDLLRRCQAGELSGEAWGDMPSKEFFAIDRSRHALRSLHICNSSRRHERTSGIASHKRCGENAWRLYKGY